MTGSTIPKSTTEQRTERGSAYAHRPRVDPGAHAGPGEQKGRPDHIPFHATQDRTEPSWIEPSAAPFAGSPYGAGEPAHSSMRPSPKRKAMRLMLMAGIFVVGAGAGLIGAWWINEPSVLRTDPVVETPAAAPVVTVRKPERSQSATKVRGINPSELPYDGAAPPDGGQAAPAPGEPVVAKRQMPRAVPPLSGATPKPAVPRPEASGPSAGEPSKTDSAGAAAAEELPSIDSGGMESAAPAFPAEGGDRHAGADKEDSSPAPQPEAAPPKPSLKAASQAKDSEGRKTSITQKRAAPTRSAKDREIERIRQQAEEELKKKPESGRLLGRSRGNRPEPARAQSRRAGVAPVRTASANERNVRATLARCERASNIFRREQCKWRICGGAWGKNGCPYYPPPQVSNSY